MLHPLLVVFLVDAGIQVLAYAISAPLKTERFYDLSGSLTYMACFLTALLYRTDGVPSSSIHPRPIIAVALSLVWCSRLAKSVPVCICVDWQIAWVWFTGLAVYFCATNPTQLQPALNALDIVGIVIWVFGFGVEAVSDYQKNDFKNKNPTKFIQSGLWSWSRHPNYFGEVVLWIGMFLLCVNGFTDGWSWFGIASPVFVFCLLYFGSGVKLLEESSDKRYGHLPEYQAYKARTSIFVLWPPKKGMQTLPTAAAAGEGQAQQTRPDGYGSV
ncbi:hypothetical protein BCR44DRAFT_1493000 [Catenaria anguillulae PL171]|uniref:Uncharacterized protein n=1 Tax=Catenaria anguillulae PL171 TaxID=765915 RepID=A0A1Y2HQA7_9FUNG|nr:hypothetical protein BCR44DRAFT_1493000 [Catenaria anguillulae PL171]